MSPQSPDIIPRLTRVAMLCFLFIPAFAFGKIGYFEWTPLLRDAYQQAVSLRFQEAELTLQKARGTDPDNLMILHVENYLDFFRVYINEDKAEFAKLEKNKDSRIETISRLGDRSSPYYLFLQADIRLHWALARLKFEEYLTAFFETNKAFKLLTKNESAFPEFLPNKKDLGILHAMAGTIPDQFKWAFDWFSSLEGTMDQGKKELLEVIEFAQKEPFVYKQEVFVYYAYLLLHLGNESEEAWQILSLADLDPSANPLACFVMANVAMRAGKGDMAIEILENRPAGKEFHPFHYLDYMLGLAKLQRLDRDAGKYFERYLSLFKGRNFIKDTLQKLAWLCLLNGDINGYRTYMQKVRSDGFMIVGSDKNAMQESLSGEIPSVDLLKARLLFDGGRFFSAYQVLQGKQPGDYFSKKNSVEFTYRMGRIMHKLASLNEAIAYYQQTIDLGKNEPWYYACRAALEMGLIYEAKGDGVKARLAFELCQSIHPEDHKTGLHQQAKAGLRRLKK